MAKRNKSNTAKRDAFVHRYRSPVRKQSRLNVTSLIHPISLIEDRRQWHPLNDSRLRQLHRTPAVARLFDARLVVRESPLHNQPSQTKGIVTFAEPRKVPVCVRRNVRKQVLHAKGVAGSKVRPPRRNSTSDIDCR